MSVGAERTENHRRWSSVVSEKWRMCAAATMLHSDQLKATEIKAGNKCIQSGLRHLHEEHPKANRRKKQRLPLARWKNGGQSTNRLVPGSVSTRQGSTASTTSRRWGSLQGNPQANSLRIGYTELAPREMKIRQNCSSPNARSFVKIGCLADAGAALTLRGSDPGR